MGFEKFSRVMAIMLLLASLSTNMAGCAPKAVLLYDDSNNHYAAQALNRLHYAYTTVNTMEDFFTVFQSREWDLVVMDNPSLVDGMTGALPLIEDFIKKGAKAVISSMNMGQWPSMSLWSSFGFQFEGLSNLVPMPVFKVNSTLQIWKWPNAAPELDFEGAADLYPKNGFPGSAIGS